MCKIKKTLAIIAIALISYVSCKKDDCVKPSNTTNISEYLGYYPLGYESFYVPFDDNGNPIHTEKRSLENEVVLLIKGLSDTLIVSSPTLGNIKAIPKMNGDSLQLSIAEQAYNGFLNITGEALKIKALDNF